MNTDNLFHTILIKIIQKYKSFNRDYSDCIDESEFFYYDMMLNLVCQEHWKWLKLIIL